MAVHDEGNGVWLIGAQNGLYRLDAAGSLRPVPGFSRTERIFGIVGVGGGRWLISGLNGLYWLDELGLSLVEYDYFRATRGFNRIVEAGDGSWIVGTKRRTLPAYRDGSVHGADGRGADQQHPGYPRRWRTDGWWLLRMGFTGSMLRD